MFNDIIQHSCFGKPLYEPSVTLKNAKSSIECFHDKQGKRWWDWNGSDESGMLSIKQVNGI